MKKCPYCKVRFYNKRSLTRHIKFIHAKEVVCVLCGKSIFNNVLVEHHIEYFKWTGKVKRDNSNIELVSTPDILVTLCRSCHIKEHLPLH